MALNWSLQHKRDTAANWTANNPTLLAGQLGIETDNLTTTPKFKVGDGTTAWNSLPYFYGGSLSAQDIANVLSVGNDTGGLSLKMNTGTTYYGATNQAHIQNVSGLELHNSIANTLCNLSDAGLWKVDAVQYMPNLTGSRLLSLDSNKYIVNETGTGILTLTSGVISYDTSTYLTTSAAALTYQPLDSDLTSWAGVTRAANFDTFVATPSSANLISLVTDETGSGSLVFGTSPTFTTQITVQGDIIADQSTSAVYLGNITPSSTNYALKYTAANEVSLNAPTTLRFRCGGTLFATGSSTDLTINGTAGLSVANNANDTKITLSRTTGNTHSIQLTTSDYYLYNNAAAAIRYGVTNAGNFYVGAKSALATTATDGFLYVPSCAGTPTGVPTAITGKIPVCADSTNNKLYIYSGGAWVALN